MRVGLGPLAIGVSAERCPPSSIFAVNSAVSAPSVAVAASTLSDHSTGFRIFSCDCAGAIVRAMKSGAHRVGFTVFILTCSRQEEGNGEPERQRNHPPSLRLSVSKSFRLSGSLALRRLLHRHASAIEPDGCGLQHLLALLVLHEGDDGEVVGVDLVLLLVESEGFIAFFAP